jgi:hypothetical protein
MPITNPKFKDSVHNFNKVVTEKVNEKVIKGLMYIGEQGVNEARDAGSYKDQTGNLRSSIGCVVLKDGQRLYRNLRLSTRSGADKQTGLNTAEKVGDKIASEFNSGMVMAVYAAMPYAGEVEKRQNVLSSAQLLCERKYEEKMVGKGLIKRG